MNNKLIVRVFMAFLAALFMGEMAMAQRPVITHNIGTSGSLTITAAQFDNDYI